MTKSKKPTHVFDESILPFYNLSIPLIVYEVCTILLQVTKI